MEWKGRKTEEDTGNLSSKLGHIVSAIMNNSVSKVSRVYSETTLYIWNVFWDSTYPEPIVSSFLCFLTSFLSFTFQRLSYLFLLLSFSHVRLFVAPWTAHQDSMSSTISQSLLKLMTSKSIIPSNHLILHCPLLLLPSIFPSHQGLFQWVSSLYQVVKVLEFHFNISPSNEYSGVISFRIDWLNLLAVQGTLKSLLRHPSLKASILQSSVLFMIQLSHL